MTVISFAALGLLGGCLSDSLATCSNRAISETPSPDAKLQAVVFTRDCGATTGYGTHVSILPSSAALSPKDGGNLFIADANHGAAPSGPGTGPDVQVEWVGRNRLRLRHDHRARVFKAEQLVAGVRVEYLAPTRCAAGCSNAQRPNELTRLIQAADHVGLVRERSFIDTVAGDRNSPQFRAQLDSGFLALPAGAATIILASDRFVLGQDSSTSFSISAYMENGRLQLVHVFAPLVNGTESQNQQMLATLDSVAGILAGDTTGLFTWVDSSWQAVWRGWEHARARNDMVKEKRFGNYLMAVSGVPPDFVFFGALRVH